MFFNQIYYICKAKTSTDKEFSKQIIDPVVKKVHFLLNYSN